jgi:dihydrofolate synthase / folylpolyglutamate synthase
MSLVKLENWIEQYLEKERFRPNTKLLLEVFSPIIKEFQKRKIKVFTIGGTNGKGETAFSLEALLSKKYKTALWTSPHVVSVAERYVFNSQRIDEEQLFEALETCFKQQQKILKKSGYTLSYYEHLFYTFCQEALKRNVNAVIFEVGLGGRLDAVNLFEPTLTAITSISRDHTEILGRNYWQILNEKLGITRPKVPLLTGVRSAYLVHLINSHCQKTKVPVLHTNASINNEDLNYSQQNKKLAAALFLLNESNEIKDLDSRAWELSLSMEDCQTPGRLVSNSLDNRRYVGAHNLDGMRVLTHRLVLEKKIPQKILLSFSSRTELEICSMIQLVKSLGDDVSIFLSSFEHMKASKEIPFFYKKNFAGDPQVNFLDEWQHFFKESENKSNELIAGSYYFIGVVKNYCDNLLEN